jgi:biotin-dependent carboxylase-like uncharacterized protein
MDRQGFAAAGTLLGRSGSAGIEFTANGIAFAVEGEVTFGAAGGAFVMKAGGRKRNWPAKVRLVDGDTVDISPGGAGNYGYLRFDAEIGVEPVIGSRATNLVARVGGREGRALKKGDRIPLTGDAEAVAPVASGIPEGESIAVLPGLHADQLGAALLAKFADAEFRISRFGDRMGIRLDDPGRVFVGVIARTLVSDAVVPGDVQILGDGTPVVLMRDHQPTGGYPRIATVLDRELDRLAQMRPGTAVRFLPVTLAHAHRLTR